MKTCAYCGSEVKGKYCSYCDMDLIDRYILDNGNRLSQSISHLPLDQDIFKTTKELIQLETIELLCLLRIARKYRSEIYNWRILTHRAESAGGEVNEMKEKSFEDYEDATRKVWVIENIIKDRIGYYPKKVTEDFINMYNDRIEESEKKKMFMQKLATTK